MQAGLSFVPTGALNIAAYALTAHYVKNTITCLYNAVTYNQHFDMIDLFSFKLFQTCVRTVIILLWEI